jgi:hypothetical protein
VVDIATPTISPRNSMGEQCIRHSLDKQTHLHAYPTNQTADSPTQKRGKKHPRGAPKNNASDSHQATPNHHISPNAIREVHTHPSNA